MKRLSQEIKNQVVEKYKQGVERARIAEDLGLHPNSIGRIIKSSGAKLDRTVRFSPSEIEYIIGQYSKGINSEELAAEMNRDPSSICRILKRNGIAIRPGTENKRTYKIREDFFENINSEESAYYLGLFYADGSLSSKKGSGSVRILLQDIDSDVINDFSKRIYGFVKYYSEKKWVDEGRRLATYLSVPIYCKKVHSDLVKWGCPPKKSHIIRFPKFLDNSLIHHFIRGYVDGDGCFSISSDESKLVVDITSNYDFIDDIGDKLKDMLGISFYKRRRIDGEKSGCLQIAGKDSLIKFINFIYKDASIYMKRKRSKAIEILEMLEGTDKVNKKSVVKRNNIHFYGTTYIPEFNGVKLTYKNLSKLEQDALNKAVDYAVGFYQANGFPHINLTPDELYEEYNNLYNLDVSELMDDNKVINATKTTAMNVAKHFSHHFYQVKGSYSSKPSMEEAFYGKELRDVIFNRIEQKKDINGSNIKLGLRNSKAAFISSLFNCPMAKFIYQKYCSEGDIIYDYSMGFGQRLFSALCLPFPVKYVGVDPCAKSYQSNCEIVKFYSEHLPVFDKEFDLFEVGSEKFLKEEYAGNVKLAFSSPPYFDTEIYDNDERQAYSNGYMDFIHKYWKPTVSNIKSMLRDDGFLVINLAEKVQKIHFERDMTAIVKSSGFQEVDRMFLQVSRNDMFNNKNRQGPKLEPVIVYKKI